MHEHPISVEHVRRIAALSRLAITDDEAEAYQHDLAKVLGYIDRLRRLDLSGVEPLVNVGDVRDRTRADEPGPTLPTRVLLDMAPESFERFVRIPTVLGDGGGA